MEQTSTQNIVDVCLFWSGEKRFKTEDTPLPSHPKKQKQKWWREHESEGWGPFSEFHHTGFLKVGNFVWINSFALLSCKQKTTCSAEMLWVRLPPPWSNFGEHDPVENGDDPTPLLTPLLETMGHTYASLPCKSLKCDSLAQYWRGYESRGWVRAVPRDHRPVMWLSRHAPWWAVEEHPLSEKARCRLQVGPTLFQCALSELSTFRIVA